MNTERLHGLIAATPTPVHADFSPDVERLIPHCERLLDKGCHGINLLGTTGEATSFSVAQRVEVMQAVARCGLPLERVMVGTGAAALDDAVALTRAACELGYAGALLVPPFYYPGIDGASLVAYVDELLRRVDPARLRLYLYHIPQNTQVPWPLEAVTELRRRHGERLVGLKDSAGDLAYSCSVAAALPAFDVFPSAEGSIARAAADGFAGCISATLNITAAHARSAWDQRSGAAHERALSIANEQRRILSRRPLVASVKAALAARYDDLAWARVCPPLTPLTAAERDALAGELASADGAVTH